MFHRQFLRGFLDLIYGRQDTCTLCGHQMATGQAVCSVCRQEITGLRQEYNTCRNCGRLLEEGDVCNQCLQQLFYFQQACVVGPYRDLLRDYVHQFKYQGRRDMAKGFAALLAEVLRRQSWLDRIQLLVPVPLYWKKQAARNYNQSRLLARHLADILDIPLGTALLVKVSDTPSQTALTREQRMVNVRNTFRAAVPAAVQDRNILLVDDIITTGSTVSECARALLEAGARGVWVAAIASGVTRAASEARFDTAAVRAE